MPDAFDGLRVGALKESARSIEVADSRLTEGRGEVIWRTRQDAVGPSNFNNAGRTFRASRAGRVRQFLARSKNVDVALSLMMPSGNAQLAHTFYSS